MRGEQAVGLLYAAERETVGDKGRGVDTALGYETEYLGAVAAVHPACLEYQVLAIHVGQWEDLGTVIHGDNGNHGIGTGTLPGHAEGFLRTGHFQDSIGSSMGTQTPDRLQAMLRIRYRHFGIMLQDKMPALGGFLAHDDAAGSAQHRAEQGADTGRTGPDDKDGVLSGGYFRNAGRPESGGKEVAGEKCLRVAHPVRNAGQSLIGVRHPDILGLPTVNTAAEGPASERVAAVVHIAVTAEEAFSAECLNIDRYPVARTDIVHGRTHSLHHPDHLVSEGDAGHSPGHAPVQDMQVTRADAPEGQPH